MFTFVTVFGENGLCVEPFFTFSMHSETLAAFPNGNRKCSIPLKNHFKTFRKRLQTLLRANVGIYRESQISSEKSNFGLYHSNNPLVWLFQKMILKNPQALCIWIILEKFENSQKNTIFIHEISHNFEGFQRNSTGAKDLLLTSSSSHI